MPVTHRSLLFVPGHRESMLAKAAGCGADAVVFDLEDSVPVSEKDAARARVTQILNSWDNAAGPSPYVRINAPRMQMLAADAAVLAGRSSVGIVVPKVDRPAELAMVFDAVGNRDHTLLVNIETPRSLLHVEDFADTWGVDGLFLGGEDLTNALGTRRTPNGHELDWARSMLLLAARAGGIAAYDTISTEFRDLNQLRAECTAAARMGFHGKFAIHPAQIAVIHVAFTPSPEEAEQAGRVVAAFDAAVARGEGAVAVDGQMVDPPVAERARAVLTRAARPG